VDGARASLASASPRDSILEELADACERGDYLAVRSGARKALASTVDPVVRAAIEEIVARTRPDPRAALFFGLAAALLCLLSVYWRVLAR
jgi:Na+/H+-translocating membrane pyrophosphatase